MSLKPGIMDWDVWDEAYENGMLTGVKIYSNRWKGVKHKKGSFAEISIELSRTHNYTKYNNQIIKTRFSAECNKGKWHYTRVSTLWARHFGGEDFEVTGATKEEFFEAVRHTVLYLGLELFFSQNSEEKSAVNISLEELML